MTTNEDLAALLRELVTGQQKILAAIEQKRPDRFGLPSLRGADRELLAKILPAIVGALGSEPFASRDLCEGSAGLRVVLRGLSAKSIGRLRSRAEGVPIGGLVVQRAGVELGVVLWRVLAC